MASNLILYGIQLLLVFLIFWNGYIILRYTKHHQIPIFERFWTGFIIGIITDFLDTLGIGTFATTTTFLKLTKLIDDDRKLPATMTATHIIPVLVEALLFITIVQIDLVTLIAMATAAFCGALVGSHITKSFSTSKIQGILGTLLVCAAGFMLYRHFANPGEGLSDTVRGLHGINLLIGISFDFVVGILMSMGLGNYAPELIFFSLMGIHPSVALPVMMLNASMIMTASSHRFIESGRVNWKGTFGITIGGVIGVLIATTFYAQLNINHLKLLVVIIATFTGVSLLRQSLKRSD